MKLFSRDKTIWEGDDGGFKCKITQFKTEVSTLNGDVKFSFGAGRYIHGFFHHCATNEAYKEIWYIIERIFTVSEILPQDMGFVDGVNKEIAKYVKRTEKKAAVNVIKGDMMEVTEEEKRDLEWVKKSTERGEMTRQQRRKAEREFQKEAKKVLDEERAEKDVQKDKKYYGD